MISGEVSYTPDEQAALVRMRHRQTLDVGRRFDDPDSVAAIEFSAMFKTLFGCGEFDMRENWLNLDYGWDPIVGQIRHESGAIGSGHAGTDSDMRGEVDMFYQPRMPLPRYQPPLRDWVNPLVAYRRSECPNFEAILGAHPSQSGLRSQWAERRVTSLGQANGLNLKKITVSVYPRGDEACLWVESLPRSLRPSELLPDSVLLRIPYSGRVWKHTTEVEFER